MSLFGRAPVPAPLAAMPPTPEMNAGSALSLRVLLVEDDPLQARGLQRLLDTMGILVHNVPTIDAALAAVATQPSYDAIISDLLLPDLPGDELARRLRRPLLIAYSGRSGWPPWFDAGLTKPAVEELLQLLRARRLDVAITELGGGDCFGICRQKDLRCHGRSPVHVLRMLAEALDTR